MPHDTYSPAQIATAFVEGAVAKSKVHPAVLFGKAFNGGMFLAFGATLSTIVGGGSAGLTASNPGIERLLSAAVFPVGLMMSMPMAVMCRRLPWHSLPLNWFIVFWGNLVGSLFWDAILVKYTEILNADYRTFAVKYAITKAVTPEWHQIFLRGIGCNILVCIAVWQATGARETISKVIAIWIPVFCFVACSFDHVIANMYFVPLGIMFGAPITVGYYIKKSLIAAFLGNVVGALIIGIPYKFYYLSSAGAFDATSPPKDIEEGLGMRDGTLGGAPKSHGKEIRPQGLSVSDSFEGKNNSEQEFRERVTTPH